MAIQRKYLCDHDDCNHWAEEDLDEKGVPVCGWLEVYEADSQETFHYCSWNCLMLEAAKVPMSEEYDETGQRLESDED